MMEFGKSLRAAREAKGFTVLQLAEMTHLAPSVVENLENEDFSHIAAPIYGRGFVKLYCEAVGLVPKPLIDQFMDILNGTSEPRIRERPAASELPVAETEQPAAEAPLHDPIPTPPPQQDLFRSQTPLEDRKEPPLSMPTPPPPPPAAVTEPEQQAVSKYATPFRASHGSSPQVIWRTGVLALVALAVILLIFFGLRSLHRATSSAAAPDQPTTAEPVEAAPSAENPPAPKDVPPAAKPAAPRTAQDIPSLYID